MALSWKRLVLAYLPLPGLDRGKSEEREEKEFSKAISWRGWGVPGLSLLSQKETHGTQAGAPSTGAHVRCTS